MRILIALLIGLLTKDAYAQPTVSIGTTVGNTQPNGIWWQKEYPRSYDKIAPSFSIRFDKQVAPGWSVGAGYTFMGNFRSDALAVSSDPAYAANSQWPISRWIGSQRQDGLFVAARRTIGSWYIEGGPMLVRTSFSMFVPDYVPSSDYPTNLIPDLANQHPLYVGQPRQMRVELAGGIGYKFSDSLSLQLNLHPTRVLGNVEIEQGGPGLLKGYSGNLSLGCTFTE
jgi:hypothetical protein